MIAEKALIGYINIAAEKLSITLPELDRIKKLVRSTRSKSIMLVRGLTQLWIDREYIAHSNADEECICYVYLTKKHIHEENKSYAIARRLRNIEVYLPQSIRAEFRKAQEDMIKTGLDHYIDYSFFKLDSKYPEISRNILNYPKLSSVDVI